MKLRLLDPADPATGPVDLGTAVDGMLWIALLAEKGFDKAEWLKPGAEPSLLNIGFEPDLPAASLDDAQACPGLNAAAGAPQLQQPQRCWRSD